MHKPERYTGELPPEDEREPDMIWLAIGAVAVVALVTLGSALLGSMADPIYPTLLTHHCP